MTTDIEQSAVISEDGGEFSSAVPIKDLLDRFELLYPYIEELSLIRRIYNDRDLSSVFKLVDDDDLRRAVMEGNLHSLFRVLENYEPRMGNHEDLRKAVLEKNPHSIFRCLEETAVVSGAANEDLRKSVLDQNLHSLFRVLENYESIMGDHEDLRKAVLDQNLHSLFRLMENNPSMIDLMNLRKAVLDQNIHSIFRIFQNANIENIDIEDLRKAVTDQNIKSLFRIFQNVNVENIDIEDLRKAVISQNVQSIFRFFDQTDDLRRAVTDQNLRSLFRLYDAQAEDLAKSINDQNLYSIFRLYESTDYLRKSVIDKNIVSLLTLLDLIDIKKLLVEDNRFSMYRILNDYIPESNILKSLRQMEVKNIPFAQDCVSRGQLQSKIWLIDHLKTLDLDLGCVFLCAGWYATLATMMFEQGLKISKVRSFDMDPVCESIAELFNKPWVVDAWKFKSTTKDIMDINYKIEEYTVKKHDGSIETLWDIPDTVINTSCEHIEEFAQWYDKMPPGCLLILQTNNFVDIEDHVNCSTTLEDFAVKTPMAECLFQGELDLGNYKRFMRIGYR